MKWTHICVWTCDINSGLKMSAWFVSGLEGELSVLRAPYTSFISSDFMKILH